MKIVIADYDEDYLAHFIKAMSLIYESDVEVITFSKEDACKIYLEKEAYDIYLYSMDFAVKSAPKGVSGCLVNNKDIHDVSGVQAINKYQRVDLIYKSLLNLYAEEKEEVAFNRDVSVKSPVMTFVSAHGGVGKSTIALTYARSLSTQGKRVFYLSLEDFSSIDQYFCGSGNTTFSNVIFAIKCGKGNLSLKIESSMKEVYGQIFYFAPPKNAGEIHEVKRDEWKILISELQKMDKFDVIIIDTSDIMSNLTQSICEFSTKLIVVSNGTVNSVSRTKCMVDWFKKIDEMESSHLSTKMINVCNRYSGPRIEIGIPVIAQIPKYSEKDQKECVEELLMQGVGSTLNSISQTGGV